MDPRLIKGFEFFNSQEYFEAHEVWEELWVEESGARHAFLQCLIQVAVALHHASNENWKGARKLFASALGYLEKGRADSEPVDMDQLRESILEFDLSIQERLTGKTTELSFFRMPFKDKMGQTS